MYGVESSWSMRRKKGNRDDRAWNLSKTFDEVDFHLQGH